MEILVRLSIFLAILAVMALWETASPRRVPSQSRRRRWVINLSLAVCAALLVRIVPGGAAFGAAVYSETAGWGVLNTGVLSGWAGFAAAVLLLDLAVYLQHVMSHAVPLFWRFHRVHHADLDIDTTTGLRFHPVEILASMLYKMGLVLAIGPDPWAVIVFETVLNGASMFNHGNVRIAGGVDRVLRWLIVTPDMHRIHHSTLAFETNSNFGFSVSFWDRLFGTYRAMPRAGQLGMDIGLAEHRDAARLGLAGLLLRLPIERALGSYSFRRADSDR